MKAKLTPLERTQALFHILLALLALLELLDLHLLAELLALALAPLVLALLDSRLLVKQPLADALHVRVRLDHLREIVCGAGEGEVVFGGERAGGVSAVQGLLVARNAALASGGGPKESAGRTRQARD